MLIAPLNMNIFGGITFLPFIHMFENGSNMIHAFIQLILLNEITFGEGLTLITILFAVIGGVWFLGKSFGQINARLEEFKPDIDKIPEIDSKVKLLWDHFEDILNNRRER